MCESKLMVWDGGPRIIASNTYPIIEWISMAVSVLGERRLDKCTVDRRESMALHPWLEWLPIWPSKISSLRSILG